MRYGHYDIRDWSSVEAKEIFVDKLIIPCQKSNIKQYHLELARIRKQLAQPFYLTVGISPPSTAVWNRRFVKDSP